MVAVTRTPATLRRGEIATHRFRIEPELSGDSLLRQAFAPQPQDLSDFDHRDLAIHPRLLAPGAAREPESLGKVLKKSSGRV
jgi:hypothetical protein